MPPFRAATLAALCLTTLTVSPAHAEEERALTIPARVERLEKKLDRVQEDIRGLQARFDVLMIQFKRLDKAVDADAVIGEARTATANTAYAEVQRLIGAVKGDVGDLKKWARETQDYIAGIGSSLSSLTQWSTDARIQLKQLKARRAKVTPVSDLPMTITDTKVLDTGYGLQMVGRLKHNGDRLYKWVNIRVTIYSPNGRIDDFGDVSVSALVPGDQRTIQFPLQSRPKDDWYITADAESLLPAD